jgi:hypothetical protein
MYRGTDVVHRFVIGYMSGPGAAAWSVRTFQNENTPAGFRQCDARGKSIWSGPNHHSVESICGHLDVYFTWLG